MAASIPTLRDHLTLLVAWATNPSSLYETQHFGPTTASSMVAMDTQKEPCDDDDNEFDDEDEDVYFNDAAFRQAEDFETFSPLFNRKRDGKCTRSTGATKLSHQLDTKQRSARRSQHVPAHQLNRIKLPWMGVRRGYHGGCISFTPEGQEGGLFFATRLQNAVTAATARVEWQRSAACGMQTAKIGEDRIAARIPFAVTQ